MIAKKNNMRIWLLIILIWTSVTQATSQNNSWQKSISTKIHPSIPAYMFVLTEDSSKFINKFGLQEFRCRIIQTDNNNTIQNILFESIDTSYLDNPNIPGFEIQDFNFDGYKDIKLFKNASVTSGFFQFWLYNPASGQFALQVKLSELPSPTFNVEKKLIKSRWKSPRCPNDIWYTDSYQLVDNILFQIKCEEAEVYDEEESANDYNGVFVTQKMSESGIVHVESKRIQYIDSFNIRVTMVGYGYSDRIDYDSFLGIFNIDSIILYTEDNRKDPLVKIVPKAADGTLRYYANFYEKNGVLTFSLRTACMERIDLFEFDGHFKLIKQFAKEPLDGGLGKCIKKELVNGKMQIVSTYESSCDDSCY